MLRNANSLSKIACCDWRVSYATSANSSLDSSFSYLGGALNSVGKIKMIIILADGLPLLAVCLAPHVQGLSAF
jgi:hypothetical protein